MILKNGKRIDSCSDTVPIGSLNPFLGTTAPFGYLICQGQLVSKTTYPELYAICGSTFGTETATEFYLPDLRGQTIAGYKEGDSTFGTLGGLIGSKTINYTPAGSNSGTAVTLNGIDLSHSGGAVQSHTLTAAESGLPGHNHEVQREQNQKASGGNWDWGGPGGFDGGIHSYTSTTGGWNASQGHSHGFTQPSNHSFTPTTKTVTNPTFTGTAATLDNIQPTAVLNWIVKAVMLIPNQSTVVNTENDSQTNVYSCDYMNTILEQMKREAFDFAHPVGSYYETSSATWNPTAAGWYGTWVEDTQGRSTIARGTPTQNNNTNHGSISAGELGWDFQLGNTLGEYNHPLTIGELPAHAHGLTQTYNVPSGAGPGGIALSNWEGSSGVTSYTGSNGAHNTIQASIVVVRWHRIA